MQAISSGFLHITCYHGLNTSSKRVGLWTKFKKSWNLGACKAVVITEKRYIGHLAEGKTISSGAIWIAVDRNAQFTFEKLPRL